MKLRHEIKHEINYSDINGGNISVVNPNGRDADGLDSNGDIHISGGSLFISLTGNGTNSAIDYGSENGGACDISGGRVIACGSSGMAEGFDSTSSQGFIMQNITGDAGVNVTLSDKSGNILISEAVPCPFTNIIISTPDIKIGDTVTLTVGESVTEITVDNKSSGFPGGDMQREKSGEDFDGFDGKKNFENGDGETDTRPQMPDFSGGELPEMPDGKPPEKPDGDKSAMPNGEPPEKPKGNSDIRQQIADSR